MVFFFARAVCGTAIDHAPYGTRILTPCTRASVASWPADTSWAWPDFPEKHGRSGRKPIPGFVPESYVIVVQCLWILLFLSRRETSVASHVAYLRRERCTVLGAEPGDRRALDHPAADVASLWKMFIENMAKDQQSTAKTSLPSTNVTATSTCSGFIAG